MNSNNLYNVAIQTTPIGMYPGITDTPINMPENLSNLDFVVDIVYNPRETKFIKDMRAMNIKTINGIGMLFYQAVKAFEIWNDLIIDESICLKAYKRFLDYLEQ
jgi:shikimate dehydrogenase